MRPRFLMLAAAISLGASSLAAQTEGEDPRNVIAAQIRDQGFDCDDPQSATQDMQASRPDEAVWILQCKNASYRVRLDPDMAAKIERLNGKEDTER